MEIEGEREGERKRREREEERERKGERGRERVCVCLSKVYLSNLGATLWLFPSMRRVGGRFDESVSACAFLNFYYYY